MRYLAILLGATAGFLVYNLHPASIFLGDSGSLLIGFSLAALTLTTGHRSPGMSEVLTIVAGPVLVLLVPIFDTTLVTLSRWMSGRSPAEGGADHTSHRLVAIGLSERRAVAVLWRTSVDAQTTTGIGATYTITPTMISETRINYYRFRNDTTWPGYGTDFGALLGIPNIGKGSMPNITGTGNTRCSYVAQSRASMSKRPSTYKEDISKLIGQARL